MKKNENHEEILNKIQEDPDFIYSKQYNNSLKEALESKPNGLSDAMISNVLLIDKSQVDTIYIDIINKIRKHLKIDV